MVTVYLMGKKYEVPEGLTIMGALEYAGYQLVRGCGCRNGFCGACATVYRIKGERELHAALACQTTVAENMYVATLPFFPLEKQVYDIEKVKPDAQIMMQLALEMKGEENESMIRVMSGLCNGMNCGLMCGAFSGAACMMSYFDSAAAVDMIPELAEWFEDTYGSMNCGDILDDDMGNRVLKCPKLMEQTYREAKEILEEYGFDLTAMAEARWGE